MSAASYRPTVSRLVTLTPDTIISAAHIHPFASSRNNALNNGIALSKGIVAGSGFQDGKFGWTNWGTFLSTF